MNAKQFIIKTKNDGSVITLKHLQDVLLNMMVDIDAVLRKHHIPYFLNGGSALGAYRHQGFIPWDDDIDIAMLMDDFVRAISILEQELSDRYVIHCFETNNKYNVLIPGMKIRLKGTKIQEVNTLLPNKCLDCDGIFIDVFVYSRVNRSMLLDLPLRLINQGLMPIIILLENSGTNPILIKRWFKWNAMIYHRVNKNSKHIGFDLTWTFKSPFKPFIFDEDVIFPLQEMEFEGKMFFVPQNIEAYLRIAIGDTFKELPPRDSQVPKHLKDIEMP